MRCVMLIENTSATQKLSVEHGFSFYIEHSDGAYLFGTGADGKLVSNAKKLHLALKNVRAAVIPHNHFAVSGGIEALLNTNPDMLFFAKQACALTPEIKKIAGYSALGNIGKYIRRYKNSFVLFKSFQQIGENFFLMSCEETSEQTLPDKSVIRLENGEIIKDSFEHECFGVVFPDKDRKSGCVVISACSHSGIENIIKTVQKTWEGVKINSLICGLHFMGSNPNRLGCAQEQVEKTAEFIKKSNIGSVYVCHCTGVKGYSVMKNILGEKIHYLQTGGEIYF